MVSPNGKNGFRIDEAFASPEMLARIRGIRHVWGREPGTARREALSDHAALVVGLDLPAV